MSLVYLGAALMFMLGFYQSYLGDSKAAAIWTFTAMCLSFVGAAITKQQRQIRDLDRRIGELSKRSDEGVQHDRGRSNPSGSP